MSLSVTQTATRNKKVCNSKHKFFIGNNFIVRCLEAFPTEYLSFRLLTRKTRCHLLQ